MELEFDSAGEGLDGLFDHTRTGARSRFGALVDTDMPWSDQSCRTEPRPLLSRAP